jgi:hypothetical protein
VLNTLICFGPVGTPNACRKVGISLPQGESLHFGVLEPVFPPNSCVLWRALEPEDIAGFVRQLSGDSHILKQLSTFTVISNSIVVNHKLCIEETATTLTGQSIMKLSKQGLFAALTGAYVLLTCPATADQQRLIETAAVDQGTGSIIPTPGSAVPPVSEAMATGIAPLSQSLIAPASIQMVEEEAPASGLSTQVSLALLALGLCGLVVIGKNRKFVV